jgi:hypothetical protein
LLVFEHKKKVGATMIPAQPPKEYIVTKEMLKFFASQSFACEQLATKARPYSSSKGADAVLDDVELLHDEVGFPFRIISVEHMSTSGGKGIPTRGKYEIVVTELRQQQEKQE